MDYEVARKLLDKHVIWVRWALQLQEWDITVRLGDLEGTTVGTCTVSSNYKTAVVVIDHRGIEDEEDLLRTAFHELLHIMHAEFEVYRQQVREACNDDKVFDVLDVMWHNSCERLVARLERMLQHGLGLTHLKMVQMTKSYAKINDHKVD